MQALTFQEVEFSYDSGRKVVRDISVGIDHGEILSIVGPNGSGKSTFLRLASGIIRPQRGEIRLEGRPLQSYRRGDLAKRVAVVPQSGEILFPFTVTEVVLMGRAPHGRKSIFESDHDHEVARTAMRRTDVLHLSDKLITNLSGGERQRVLIARALAQETDILLLDEPNAHLDIAHQIDIFSLVKQLNKENRLTVVAVSHDLNLAAAYSHRIAMMSEGSIVANGSPDAVLTVEQILSVFRTHVIVDDHPLYRTPRITLSERAEAGGRLA